MLRGGSRQGERKVASLGAASFLLTSRYAVCTVLGYSTKGTSAHGGLSPKVESSMFLCCSGWSYCVAFNAPPTWNFDDELSALDSHGYTLT